MLRCCPLIVSQKAPCWLNMRDKDRKFLQGLLRFWEPILRHAGTEINRSTHGSTNRVCTKFSMSLRVLHVFSRLRHALCDSYSIRQNVSPFVCSMCILEFGTHYAPHTQNTNLALPSESTVVPHAHKKSR